MATPQAPRRQRRAAARNGKKRDDKITLIDQARAEAAEAGAAAAIQVLKDLITPEQYAQSMAASIERKKAEIADAVVSAEEFLRNNEGTPKIPEADRAPHVEQLHEGVTPDMPLRCPKYECQLAHFKSLADKLKADLARMEIARDNKGEVPTLEQQAEAEVAATP